MRKIYSSLKELDTTSRIFFSILLVMIIASFSTSICAFNGAINIDKQPQNWSERSSIVSDYNEMKTVFDKQKQAIIDAYNSQVKKIHANGLKTEADFDGLRFKSDIFANRIDEIKSTYSKDDTKMLALWTNLNDRVNAKIAKIKAFYDSRVRNIYSTLKNRQKVKFASLVEYNTNKRIQFETKDFDVIGSEMSRDYNEPAYFFAAIIFLVIGILLIFVFKTLVE